MKQRRKENFKRIIKENSEGYMLDFEPNQFRDFEITNAFM